jgi:hypothetical protein
MQIAVASGMDRLFERVSQEAYVELAVLADIEQRLASHRRHRRFLVGGAALASLLCWIHKGFGVRFLICAPPLFAFFAGAAATLYFWERRMHASHRRWKSLVTELGAHSMNSAKNDLASILVVDRRLQRIRSARRALTTVVAVLGVAPFFRAVAPDIVPSLIVALGMVWSALLRVLVVAIFIEGFAIRDCRTM